MEQRQPPIYHSCLQLSRLVFSITRHFPKKANYEEGGLCRRTAAAYGTQPLILALKGGTHVFSCRVILIYLCRVIKKKQQL